MRTRGQKVAVKSMKKMGGSGDSSTVCQKVIRTLEICVNIVTILYYEMS